MEIHLDFNEDFHFTDQLVSCASSAGSFSTVSSSSGPHTPASGRSTPQRRKSLMEHDAVISPTGMGFELTPPSTTFSGYLPMDMKDDFHPLIGYNISASPSRRGSIPTQMMEFDYGQMFNTPSSQNSTIESANSQMLGSFYYPEQLLASPFAPVTNICSNSAECEASSVWMCHPEDSMRCADGLEGQDPTSLHSIRNSGFEDKHRVHLDEPQHKSAALHRAQRLHRVQVKREKKEQHQVGPAIIKSGTHKCSYPECVNRKPFKRSEHLKRHVNTHHKPIYTKCPFCKNKFNRRDNWLQHIALHAKRHGPIKRTEYFEEAQALFDEQKRKSKSRSQTKKRKVEPKIEEE
uniref:BrlA n=1 Tax=Monosporascus eutypoides TaxID=1267397 RepID=A0A6B9KKR5_9PEZI|nr:BrlA [Monosporascus eutypoides]